VRRAKGILGLVGVVLAAGAAVGADFTVVQKNRAFSAKQLTVKVGDQVVFLNQDDVRHNVYSETKGLEFDLIQPPGSSNTVRFAQPGTATVQCAIHPVMKLEVRVTP
jgi:plastocyanin